MKKYAGIDIGSNTIRLIIGSFPDSDLHTEKKYLSITRLGKDLHKTGELSSQSIKRSIDTLIDFSDKIKEHGAVKVSVVATGVMRYAKNSEIFINEVFNKTGLKIKVISGEKEAHLTALGVKEALHTKDCIVFDVGGGSTEFVVSREDGINAVKSIDIGAVTLYERFCQGDPPEKEGLEMMNHHIMDEISACLVRLLQETDMSGYTLIFTAGTATTLAAIKLKMNEYDPYRVNGVMMTYDEVKSMYNDFVKKTMLERESITGLEKGREDIIISGAAIALSVMRVFNKDKMIISDAGLLEGIVIDCYKNQ